MVGIPKTSCFRKCLLNEFFDGMPDVKLADMFKTIMEETMKI